MHTWRGQRTTPSVVLQALSTFSLNEDLSLAWSSPVQLDCLAGKKSLEILSLQCWDDGLTAARAVFLPVLEDGT